MDKEMLSNDRSGRSSFKLNTFGFLIAAALVLCTIFSSIAMTISVLTYYNYQADRVSVGVDHSWRREGISPEEDRNWTREAIAEIEATFEIEGVMSFPKHHGGKTDGPSEPSRRQRSGEDREAEFDAMCNSTSTSGNDSATVPMAHIVPKPGSYDEPISVGRRFTAPALVITKQWVCGRHPKDNQYGIISGGMIFHRSTGFLTLPIDGVYYIYSHVQFVLKDTNTTYETLARMVACIPDEECEITAPHFLTPLLESSDTASHFYNRAALDTVGENGIFQGGLFHFPANTQISLLARDPKWNAPREVKKADDKLYTSFKTGDSYMGAFLVQRLPYSRSHV